MTAPLPRLVPFLLAILVVAPSFASAGSQDEEIVEEFKRYFRKYEDTPSRVEAVLALEDVESVEVVKVLLPVLRDPEPDVVRAAVRILGGFETRPPVERILTALEEKKDAAIRAGLLRAVAGGKYPGFAEPLLACLEDSAWDVRRRALQALAATGDGSAVETMVECCEDREPAVQCAALEALATLESERVVPPAIELLGHGVWQVRASAIHALGGVRRVESIGPLIDRMAEEEGRLIEDIAQALGEITGREFGRRLDAWQRFWESYGERFVIPTDEELRRLRERQAERKLQYEPPPGEVTYHGVETPSRSILFVIDVSGSMEQEVVDKERFRDGEYPSFERIDIVKTELMRTVEGLDSYVKFNILSFATDVKAWKKSLVGANVLNKSSAATWLGRLEALGGASKTDLARAGLTGSANLEAGRTNTYGALMHALGVGTAKRKPQSYTVAVDTIFFLSDGDPSAGEYVDTRDILREVREANELRKVVIHTLAIGEFQRGFMRQLASENGGVFVDLGR